MNQGSHSFLSPIRFHIELCTQYPHRSLTEIHPKRAFSFLRHLEISLTFQKDPAFAVSESLRKPQPRLCIQHHPCPVGQHHPILPTLRHHDFAITNGISSRSACHRFLPDHSPRIHTESGNRTGQPTGPEFMPATIGQQQLHRLYPLFLPIRHHPAFTRTRQPYAPTNPYRQKHTSHRSSPTENHPATPYRHRHRLPNPPHPLFYFPIGDFLPGIEPPGIFHKSLPFSRPACPGFHFLPFLPGSFSHHYFFDFIYFHTSSLTVFISKTTLHKNRGQEKAYFF